MESHDHVMNMVVTQYSILCMVVGSPVSHKDEAVLVAEDFQYEFLSAVAMTYKE